MGTEQRIYVMGVDYSDGRNPTFERQFAWLTTEESARRYFARETQGWASWGGYRVALICNGLVIA
jgi:hypothetical protein